MFFAIVKLGFVYTIDWKTGLVVFNYNNGVSFNVGCLSDVHKSLKEFGKEPSSSYRDYRLLKSEVIFQPISSSEFCYW